MASTERAAHAVVIGSSICGMCAARVLSRHYERVTIIERDKLPEGPEHRPGVPQSHHGHGLLLRGLEELNRFFPGFEQRLLALGAKRVDLGGEFGHYSEWGWSPREKNGVVPIAGSRLGIESTMRDLMFEQIDNLTVLQETRVRELIVDRGDRLQVTGVEVQGPEGKRTLEADLVVDASGKNGKLFSWLKKLGLPEPPVEVVDSKSAYASRFYRTPTPRPPEWWWKGLLIDACPPDQRKWAMLLPGEGDVLVLILAGVNGEDPPTDEAGFNEYMRNLRTPYLADALARCEPISGIHGNKPLFNRWRHFEKWSGQLDNYLCMGDLLCTFNPLHGQGIAVGAVGAANLGEMLDKVGTDGRKLPPAFYKHNAKFLEQPWSIATTLDLQWPGTIGKRPLLQQVAWPVARAIARSIHEDAKLQYFLGRGFHLLDKPTAIIRPHIIWRMIYTIVRRMFRGPALAEDYNPMALPAPSESTQAEVVRPEVA